MVYDSSSEERLHLRSLKKSGEYCHYVVLSAYLNGSLSMCTGKRWSAKAGSVVDHFNLPTMLHQTVSVRLP